MVMDAQAQSNRVADLIEKENRAMTLWMVELEKCLVDAPGVSVLSARSCIALVVSGVPPPRHLDTLPPPTADEHRRLRRDVGRCSQQC